MHDIETEVLVVGTGPGGGSMAALLSTYGIKNILINRYNWLAATPRAHITNQRTMEVLRDLGNEVEDEAYLYGTSQDFMGENVFCTSLAGDELGRMQSWGKSPESRAEHRLSSPGLMNDLPQTYMEPLLFKTACARGTEPRMSTEYLDHKEIDDFVFTRCLDKLAGKEFIIKSKYLIGADGGNSQVAKNAELPFQGQMGVAGSINILIEADLTRFVAHRPSVLYWILQPGADVGGIGMGVVRMVRPWNEWLLIWGYDINQPTPEISDEFAIKVARDLIGDPEQDVKVKSVSTWTVNNMYAEKMRNRNVFCLGDAVHRHPPSNGLGSNTSIQDSFNLAWKLAYVLKGKADKTLLDTFDTERAPIAKQIVTRANQSIDEFGPIFQALGLTDTNDPIIMKKNMQKRFQADKEGEGIRERLRKAIAFKNYEFDAHGVDMNQRYYSNAIENDGQKEPAFKRDKELHFDQTSWPGARLPHVWVFDRLGKKVSTLDLAGKGMFSIFTGLNGKAWVSAAEKLSVKLNIEISTNVIGPGAQIEDYTGDWARVREIDDGGALIVRPDQHVCARFFSSVENSGEELERVFKKIFGISN
jgi:2,4-dichlorophenol 6-monooxygenase